MKTHDKTNKKKKEKRILVRSENFLLKVNVTCSSAKTNILFDGAVTPKVKLYFLSGKETSDYLLNRT